jgi:hypothetical protein
MNRAQVAQLLKNIAAGKITPEAGLEQLRFLPYEDLGFARIDHHRSLRQGVPEVIYGEGKTVDQVRIIGERILHHGSDLLATRLSPAAAEALLALAPQAEYNAIARTVVARQASSHASTTGWSSLLRLGPQTSPAEEAALRPEPSGVPCKLCMTLAWQDCTASSIRMLSWQQPGSSLSWLAWKAHSQRGWGPGRQTGHCVAHQCRVWGSLPGLAPLLPCSTAAQLG